MREMKEFLIIATKNVFQTFYKQSPLKPERPRIVIDEISGMILVLYQHTCLQRLIQSLVLAFD
jgi:hypothetical protein